MNYLNNTKTAAACLLFFGAAVPPIRAEGNAGAAFLFADMMPMPPQSSPGAGGAVPGGKMAMPPMPPAGPGGGMPGMQPGSPSAGAGAMPGGMMDDKMGMPPMPPAGPGGAMPGGMADDKMAMPNPGAAAPGGGMAGMPPAGAAAPSGMMPMPGGMKAMMDMMMGQMAKMQAPPSAPLDHVEGRIAFLRAELGITEPQAQAWDPFAQSLRSSRDHLAEARQALVVSAGEQTSVPDRLEAYEHHLSMRLDSLRAARESFQRLYTVLSPAQKQAADQLVVPFLVSF